MNVLLACEAIFISSLVLFILRILWVVLVEIRFHRRTGSASGRRTTPPLRTLVVLGSGGHTTELLTMTQGLDSKYYHPMIFCKASTDSTSFDRLKTFRKGEKEIILHDIPRSREVGQSFTSSIFTTLNAMAASWRLVYRIAPDVILCNGPGTCIPICVAGLVLRVFGIQKTTIVFVESFCRVQSLSLTGKLLYPLADLFLVHWKPLHAKYPLSVLTSAIIKQQD